ncbi:MAG: type IV toxin-antitoxin system AbiEi family antitoxin [Candidatus Sedimenticola sp. (ex Thyasira tokunagai)]
MNREIGTEQEILDCAIRAVGRETGLRLKIKRWQAQMGDDIVDAIVRLEPVDRLLVVEIKRWAQQANLGALVNQIKQLPEEGLLVADYVNPRMAEKLRQQGVQFIDMAGNAFINQPPVYVYVTGKRQEEPAFMPTKGGAKRAFEPTGLKVIYLFLCRPELVNAPYREIAETAGVALGTVGWVLNGLKAADYIRDKGGKKARRLVHYRKLLERWVEAWPEKLQPKQRVGAFIANDPYWWKEIDIRQYDGYWGGEIAAAKYTNYLKPKVATVYLPEHARIRLLRDARLRKVTEWTGEDAGTVLIYRPFWPEQPEPLDTVLRKDVVHPILAYADLVATDDPRNLEVARRIYDEHIAQLVRDD